MALLLASLLALQPAAGAPDWWYVNIAVTPGDQDAFYADRASMRRNGDRVVIDEAREGERVDEGGIIGSRTRAEYDCRARSGRLVRAAYLRPDGSSVDDDDPEETFRPVTPNSVQEALMRFACGEAPGLGRVGDQSLREHALRRFRARGAPPPPTT
jgi:surface-adhesin protein E